MRVVLVLSMDKISIGDLKSNKFLPNGLSMARYQELMFI